MDTADIARAPHGTSRAVGDDMYVHTGPPERPYGAQRSMVKGIPVDPQNYGGNSGVKQRHAFSLSSGTGSPARGITALESRSGSGSVGFLMTDFI
ncbi:hypothetical protein GCM10010293_02490 [Streptomyces griseoflavus]|nr:hypothetical protein GCM10010293_02490 [Streptomyces griseoflavus]